MFRLVLILLFGISLSLQNPETIKVEDKDERELSAQTAVTREYFLTLPSSFKLLVKVEELDVNSQNGDYLVIKRGPDFDADGTGIILTEKAIPKDPFIISSDQIYVKLFVGEEGEDVATPIRKFKLKYTALGDLTVTTTETPTSTSTWPPPGPDDKVHYKAHLYGLHDIDYTLQENVDKLKTAIAMMAAAYVKDQNMPIAQPISEENVIIADLFRCPFSWPDSDKCVTVNFAVPVVMDEDYEGYQLLAMHLEMMWLRHETILKESGFRKYEVLDIETEIANWDATFAGILIAFILLIVAITLIIVCKPTCVYRFFGKVNTPGDQVTIINHEGRESCVSNDSEFRKFHVTARLT